MDRLGIRGKMLVTIAGPTLAIYVLLLGGMMLLLERHARSEVREETARLALNYAARFDGMFREAAMIARTTAGIIEQTPEMGEAQIFEILERNVLKDEVIYGAAMAFEPGTRATQRRLFCPYVHRVPDGVHRMHIDETVYDWSSDERWQWYQVPRRTLADAWSDPYFDEGAGNVLMVTYSAPFLVDGQLRGVTTVDIHLPYLHETIGRQIVAELDWSIITSDGRYVYSRRSADILQPSTYTLVRTSETRDSSDLLERITRGAAGVEELSGEDGQRWVFYAPVQSTGWTFMAFVPEHEALAGVRGTVRLASAMLFVTLVLIVGAVWFMSGRVARPVRRLDAAVRQIASGDLNARVEQIESSDEIGRLAQRFNLMASDLRANLERLAEERTGREKIERELDLARAIQHGLMPAGPPPMEGFEIAGWNKPASQTGGDFYDWHALRGGRVMVAVADVAGHGIGPALLAADCRAYLRASAMHLPDIEMILERVNELVCDDISEGRFVTAAVGVIERRHR